MTDSLSEQMQEKLAPILGRVPSGVFILVAGDGQGKRTGMLASFVQPASFDPPQVTVAVNRSRYLNDWLSEGSPVTLSQVRKKDPSLFRHFGKGFEPDADPFDGIAWTAATNGLPQLTDAMATLEGTVESRMEAGDHIVYLVTITGATAHQDPAEFDPYVHVRKNGFSY